MKTCCYLSIVIAVCATSLMCAQDAPKKLEAITSESLNQRDVIGELGLPLGDGTEIVATIVPGRETRRKADAGRYLLRVHSVSGKELPKPLLMNFEVSATSGAALANDGFDLYELKKGEKPGSIDSAELAELEKGYVGSKVKLTVCESGGFSGLPRKVETGSAGSSFWFRTHLVVYRQLDLP